MIYLNKNFLLSCEELSGTYYYKVLNLLINYVKWKGKFKVENKFKNKRATESDKFLFFFALKQTPSKPGEVRYTFFIL